MPRKLTEALPDTPTLIAMPSLDDLQVLGILHADQRDAIATNITPTDLVRHSLFAGSNFTYSAKRPMLKEAPLFKNDWLSVTVTGEQLGQREADIYSALLALAALANSFTISVTRAALFDRLGLTHGSDAVAQFSEDLDRLQATQIRLSVETNKRNYSARGPLLFLVERLNKASGLLDSLRITLNPKFSAAFGGPRLYISCAERRVLRDDALAGWLHNYIRAKFDMTKFKLAELRELSGLAEMRTARFNEALARAANSLAKLGYELTLPRAGSRIDGKGDVLVKRPSKADVAVLAPNAEADTAKSARSRESAVPTAAEITQLEQRAAHLARVAKQKRRVLAKKAGLKQPV